jgi:hypothetical protein
MTTLADYQGKAFWKLCAYGRAKVGKTALLAQLARRFKLKWFDLEDGIKTALNPNILPKEFWGNIEVFRIPSRQDIPMGIETILKVIKGTECKICWLHGKVDCQICVKSGGVINKICINDFTPDDFLIIDSVTQLSLDANAAVLKAIKVVHTIVWALFAGCIFAIPIASLGHPRYVSVT